MSSLLALPRGTRFFVAGVVVASVGMVLFLISHFVVVRIPPNQVVPLVVVMGIASIAAESLYIMTPAGDHKTVTSAIYIALILLVGPTVTLLPALVAIVGSHVILHRPWFKALFNLGQYTLTIGISGLVYQGTATLLGGEATPDYNSAAGICALGTLSAAYFVVNSGLVAGVVSLTEGRPVLYVWNLANVETLVQYAGMIVGGIIIAMVWEIAPWSVLLVAVIVVGVYVSFSLAGSLQVAQRDLLLRMDQLQRRTAELALLNEINGALTRALDLTHLWDVIYAQAGRVFDTSCFFVVLRNEHSSTFEIAFGRVGDTRVDGPVATPNQGIIRQIQESQEPALIAGAAAVALDDGWGLAGVSRQAILAAPMIVEGAMRGALVAESARPDAYSEEDLRVLAAIADQAAVALEKARLQKEATETRALHRLNTLKTEFISTVSHELRSPLTPIVGFSELLAATVIEPERVRDLADEIHRHAQRMQRLVDDLLDVSHMEAGQFQLAMTDMDLEPLLDRTVHEFARQAQQHQILYQPPETLPLVRGDPLRVRQVLDNLLTNAIKYSPDGGRIEVAACWRDDEVIVSVADQGIGLPPDKMGRLFEKFYRVDNTLAHRVRGSGLGLSIVKHIVDAHGGRVWVESELGLGSTFTFTLPVSTVAQPAPAHAVSGLTIGQLHQEEEASNEEAYLTGG